MLALQAGAASQAGRVRPTNEDTALVSGTVFAVADGMGGHAAGDVASRIAVSRLSRLGDAERLRVDDLRAGLVAANDEILRYAAGNPRYEGMGTTIAGLGVVQLAGGRHWAIFHIGDCRVYRYVDGVLAQLTEDHSEVQELVSSGKMAAADAVHHPRRNVVTRALGTRPVPEPDLRVFPPTPGERFVICSDGLTGELSDLEIAEVLACGNTAQKTAETLCTRAVEAGGRDNVTVVVVDHPDSGEDTDLNDTVRPGAAKETGS